MSSLIYFPYSVPDTIDDILQTVGNPPQRVLPPQLHISSGSDIQTSHVDVEAMEQDDILAYIQGSVMKDTNLDLL